MTLLTATLTTGNKTETLDDTTTDYRDSQLGKKESNQDWREDVTKIGEEINRNADGLGKIGIDEVDEALEFGFKAMQELLEVKEPMLYRMGFILDENDPASKVAKFGSQPSQKTQTLAKFGYAAVEASKKLATRHPTAAGLPPLQSRVVPDENCPLRLLPRCSLSSRFYRTPDGTCNDLGLPWKGSAALPMRRFLPPSYNDGIQSERLSVWKVPLPSARQLSTGLHVERDREIKTVTSLFTQWGQFVDHDITSTAKASSFNGSTPRCCERDSSAPLPQHFLHPSCMPIEVPPNDWFLSKFNIRCMEFLRSAPSTRINCDLGWREQINQVTAYLDASTIYGSDQDTSDSIRTFRNGKIVYGRPRGQNMNPPDPPNVELCRAGAISSDCLRLGDSRADEQPGLVSLHTVFVRYHNKIATVLSKLNPHWSDEKTFQETRRIVGAAVQHITFREFLPIVVGPEVVDLFELVLQRDGYYSGYNGSVNPEIANSFSTAAFRFGHSMIQSSYVRTDVNHSPIFNNVSLHEEDSNPENIWSFGSLDRLLLGFCNQPAQRRDEFITEELTNHLFQTPGTPFGMDLAAINIQRGRDHGLPPYTAWREPCGLSPIRTWEDMQETANPEAIHKLRSLYLEVDDIDLYSGGLSERPLRGGVVGPVFACIIAQQFLNLRKGDRFWYENGGFDSSFTPAQLQQLRHISLAQILCQTLTEIKTVQPFVFLSHDSFKNIRTSCESPAIRTFDLKPWIERVNELDNDFDFRRETRDTKNCEKRRKATQQSTTTTKKPTRTHLKIPVKNITATTIPLENRYSEFSSIPKRPTFDSYGQIPSRPIQIHSNDQDDITYLVDTVKPVKYSKPRPIQVHSNTQDDMTYLVDVVKPVKSSKPDHKPIEVNINIQYYAPTTTSKVPNNKKRPNVHTYDVKRPTNYVMITKRPTTRRPTTRRQQDVSYPIFIQPNNYNRPGYYAENSDRPNYYENNEQSYRPYDTRTSTYRPTFYYDYDYDRRTSTFRPYDTTRPTRRPDLNEYMYQKQPTYNIDDVYSQLNVNDRIDVPSRPNFGQKPNKIYSTGHVERVKPSEINDKLDFKSRLAVKPSSSSGDKEYVKISSVKAGVFLEGREGDEEAIQEQKNRKKTRKVRLVNLDVSPSEIRNDKWKVIDLTKEEEADLEMPSLVNDNMLCSKETPRQINRHF